MVFIGSSNSEFKSLDFSSLSSHLFCLSWFLSCSVYLVNVRVSATTSGLLHHHRWQKHLFVLENEVPSFLFRYSAWQITEHNDGESLNLSQQFFHKSAESSFSCITLQSKEYKKKLMFSRLYLIINGKRISVHQSHNNRKLSDIIIILLKQKETHLVSF